MEKNIDFNVVADLYDYYVQTDMDIGFYLELCKDREKVLELMCGTGRVSLPLIHQRVNLTCVDYSERMLDVFHAKLKSTDKAIIHCQDICSLSLSESYDLAFIPFNSFAEITGIMKRKQAFGRINTHLAPDGLLFCTLYNPSYRIQLADDSLKLLGRYGMEDRKSLVVSYYNAYSQHDGNISGMQFYEIFDASGKLIEKRMLNICFSVVTQEEMLETAHATGFKVLAIYGDYEKRPFTAESRFMNFLFQKI